MMRLGFLLATLLLAGCAGYPVVVTPDFTALTPQPSPTSVATPEVPATPSTATRGGLPRAEGEDAEAEYYRGLYDTCMYIAAQSGRVLNCIAFAKNAREMGWYEQASPG